MLRILVLLSLVTSALTACVTTSSEPKAKWKVLSNTAPAHKNEVNTKSAFVPSGTELVFTSSKSFTEIDHQLVMELPDKRCSLTTTPEKDKETTLGPNTILTVVGYRGETSELVLSESNYQQYFLSCLSKSEVGTIPQKRKASSVGKPVTAWNKSVIEMVDLQKMAPLLKVKFIPQ